MLEQYNIICLAIYYKICQYIHVKVWQNFRWVRIFFFTILSTQFIIIIIIIIIIIRDCMTRS